MWIFLNYGFFSVTRSKDEPTKLQIRARDRRDLEDLQARHATLKGKILETPYADYRWRLLCSPRVFAGIMTMEVLKITYSNFKDSCSKRMKARPLMSVWSIMATVQYNIEERKMQLPLFRSDPQEEEESEDLISVPFPDFDRANAETEIPF